MPVLGTDGTPDVLATYERAKSNLFRVQERRRAGADVYEEAADVLEDIFRDFAWMWEHSLDYRLSMVGVRSSFMLSRFEELSKLYPPALEYLERQIEVLEHRLADGELTRLQVFDLNTLCCRFKAPARMAGHMRLLQSTQPKLAAEVGFKMWSTWIDAEDWELFRTYPRAPEDEIAFVEMFKERLAKRGEQETDALYAERLEVSYRGLNERLDKAQRAYLLAGLPELGEEFARLRQERGL